MVSAILLMLMGFDENASILDLVLKELTGSTNPLIGRNGMSAEQNPCVAFDR
jgi:hypothetical protein